MALTDRNDGTAVRAATPVEPVVTGTELAIRLPFTLAPDPRRVIVKLFVPGEDAAVVRTRAAGLVRRIAGLDESEVVRLLQETLHLFGTRHRDLEATFRHHYDLVHHRVSETITLSPAARLLVGAYFSHEYALEAASLCNPSIVVHPDQSGCAAGQLRVVLSVRQIGEGHLSSIGFATAVLGPGAVVAVQERSGPPLTGRKIGVRHHRDLLAAGLSEREWDDEVSATVLSSLPERFTDGEFTRALHLVPDDLLARVTAQRTIEQLRRMLADSYAVTFPADSTLDQRTLWPATATESNGMEDARFVRFVAEDGQIEYHATFTAYDGRDIGARLLSTSDFLNFDITPLRGPAARNKGMALFPRPVGGRRLALSRADGETLGLSARDQWHQWRTPVPLHAPTGGWELVQVGNCGSPVETGAGWLVVTHGVGPMRRYGMGALLLDLERPERVIARLPGALLSPEDGERDGYVPNVVYSCGALVHDGVLWLPYGASDSRVGFAHVGLSTLIAAMEPAAR